METFPVFVVGLLVSMTCSPGADAPVPANREPSKTPQGLNDADWSGIRSSYEKHRHAIVADTEGGYQARNPGQAWLTKFDGRGFTVTPDAGGWTWGLELAGWGAATGVRRDGGEIFYIRGEGLTEWFVNDSRGLEQGWTFSHRPGSAGGSGAFHLNLAVRGGLRPEISAGGASVAFLNDDGIATLTYGGLKAWDADGKVVPTRFVADSGANTEFRVVVEDAGATYPITVDPVARQQAYLKASNTDPIDDFGRSVAVSGDTVVIGAPGEDSSAAGVNANQADNAASFAGAAYVFVRNGTTWTQQAYLKASNPGFGDNFGHCVAVSGDTVVVGAPGESSSATGVDGNQTNNSAAQSGAAYVFVRSGTTWTQQAYLKASNTGATDEFGWSVAVSGDTVVVGAYLEDSSATGVNGNQADNSTSSSGAAYVFVRSGTAWSQQAYLKASTTEAGNQFGISIAVSGDTLVAGAPGESSSATGVNGNQADTSLPYAGAAYVFVRDGAEWTQQAYLKASNTEFQDWFGYSVAVSGDTVAVTAPSEDSSGTGVNGSQANNSAENSGAAYVFVRNGADWTQQAYLKASNTEAGDFFGYSIAVSGDRVVVGANRESSFATGVNGDETDNSAAQSGAAYLFSRSGTAWARQAYLKASNTESSDWFGYSVAVSGGTLVVGAPWEDGSATGVNGNQNDNLASSSGAAYVFSPRAVLSIAVSNGQGIVSGGGDYETGTTATPGAAPGPGYVFGGWSGDATGTDNPLSVLMDADKTIFASFVPDTSDIDGDGLSAHDEIVIYGTNPARADTDDDGYNDACEVEFGGHPLNSSTAPDFKVGAVQMTDGSRVQLRFPALQGASHNVEASTDLAHWNDLETGIIGQGRTEIRAYPSGNQLMRFFRVRRN